MKLTFTEEGWQDYGELGESDPKALTKLNMLIKETMRDPFRGLGKPEPLKGNRAGWWSRRVSHEHPLVYRVVGKAEEDQRLEIAGCHRHY